ncbi:hypothetical protein [Sulfurimonas sp. HSL3-7]|uniref:hypothetical protein n=1 Tax=Sulfonitrofixus jiaomeiensis TaxID=3131938 RepID=UPI0031FA3F84
MENDLLKEQAMFFEFIQNYEYINEQGRLDLEAFCTYLSISFSCDGIQEISPHPKDMYNLLIDILKSYAKNDEMSLWVQTQNLIDWTPEMAYMYPDKYRTYIHIAGLLYAMPDWIYQIGHFLIQIPESETTGKYFDWVKDEWKFVYTFVDSNHKFFHKFLKDFDSKDIKNKGYSNFEALHLAINNSMDYDDAVDNLISRYEIYNQALSRISNAINDGCFLEAITLEESLITHCFYNFLKAKKVKKVDTSFFKLLETYKKGRFTTKISIATLVDDLNTWRKNRNTSIHGFVTSRDNTFAKSQEQFISFSEETAKKGYLLTLKVIDWYREESVNFIQTDFPKNI